MRKHAGVAAVLLVLALSALAAQDRTAVVELAPVRKLVEDKCLACHDWAASVEGIRGKVVPGKPEESPLWRRVKADEMPPDGPLPEGEKALLRDWIASGAPTGQEAASAGSGASSRFLLFPDKVSYHRASGFTSAALFAAAGVLGTVQWATLIKAGHDYRDAQGIDEETMSPECNDYIQGLWSDPTHRAIRWTHVGLLGAGEVLYLSNALTGLSMRTPDGPGLTPADLHRYAFFTHGALMIGQLVLGALTTTFISRGNHWTMLAVGAAHGAIGFAIPAIMAGAGIAVNAGFPR